MLLNTTELKAIISKDFPDSSVTCDDLKKIKEPVLLLGGDKSPLDFPTQQA